MILIENTDTPGVIGKIGTMLGTLGINIAGLQLGRKEGGNALSVITVDEPITKEGLEKLKKLPQVLNAKWISL
jgi:D-3-phosphoglycerate dehydrogenase